MHEHTMEASDVELIRMGEKMLLTVMRPTPLMVTQTDTGEQLRRHDPITVAPWLYEVRTQRRLEPVRRAGYSGEPEFRIRKVVD